MKGELEATVRASLALVGADASTVCEVGRTLRREPSGDAPSDAASLPVIVLGEASSSDSPELLRVALLGSGGMGEVTLARQRSLGREVAVKAAHAGSAPAAHALLREARVMGALEHPNVVPVHTLGRTEEGAPLLVMKRVDGVTWSTLLREPSHPTWSALVAGHNDRLRANVEVLSQVARAVSFAHAHGVLHRDLKPENVMVGAFGEVYVLDWGLALRLEQRAEEPRGLVGTPAYLPPEMALGDPEKLDARTDVYLLGATLYEVLTGRRPHDADTLFASLTSSLLGEFPAVPESAPRELAALTRSSLSLDPAARPPSAEHFREGLVRFLASREALVLVRGAERALAEAEARIASAGLAAPELARPLLEARFALASARLTLPEDPVVTALLRACLCKLVERELALRSPGGARAFLEELSAPEPELLAKIDALESDLARERTAAEAERRAAAERDLSKVGNVSLVLAMAAAALTVLLVLAGFLRSPQDSPSRVLFQELLVYAVILVAVARYRARVLATEASRRLLAFSLLWYSYPVPLACIDLARGVQVFDWPVALVSGALLAVAGVLLGHRALWPTIPLHAATTAAMLRWPAQGQGLLAVMLVLNAAIIFRELRRLRLEGSFAPGPTPRA